MALSDHTSNRELMASTIVAIVAFVGLVIVYSNTSEAPTGAFETSQASWDTSRKIGEMCGQCGLMESKGIDLPKECFKSSASQGQIFRLNEYRGTYNCCRRACMSEDIAGFVGSTSSEMCNSNCNKAASDVFTGKTRYSGNPFDIAPYS